MSLAEMLREQRELQRGVASEVAAGNGELQDVAEWALAFNVPPFVALDVCYFGLDRDFGATRFSRPRPLTLWERIKRALGWADGD